MIVEKVLTPIKTQPVEFVALLKQILTAIQYPGWLDRTANQTRSQVTGTITTVTTTTTVTNLTNIGSFHGDHLQRMNNINAWSNTIRNKIT